MGSSRTDLIRAGLTTGRVQTVEDRSAHLHVEIDLWIR